MTNKGITKWLQSLKSEIGKQSNQCLWNYEEALDMAIEALKAQEWIPIEWHEITDEEREREGYPKEWEIYLDCNMPDDEQEILVQTKNGDIRWDIFYEDGECFLDSGMGFVEDIVAWMPLPEPYKEDGE